MSADSDFEPGVARYAEEMQTMVSIAISLKRIADAFALREHMPVMGKWGVPCSNCGLVGHDTEKCPNPVEIPF